MGKGRWSQWAEQVLSRVVTIKKVAHLVCRKVLLPGLAAASEIGTVMEIHRVVHPGFHIHRFMLMALQLLTSSPQPLPEDYTLENIFWVWIQSSHTNSRTSELTFTVSFLACKMGIIAPSPQGCAEMHMQCKALQ